MQGMRRLLAILLTLTLVTQPLLPSVAAAGLGGRGSNGEVTLASSAAADAEESAPESEPPEETDHVPDTELPPPEEGTGNPPAGKPGDGAPSEETENRSPDEPAAEEPLPEPEPHKVRTEIVLVPKGPATMQLNGQAAQVSAGELIVYYQDGSANRPSGMLGLQSHSNDAGVSLIEVPAEMDLESAMKTLQADPNVAYVEPNYLVWAATDGPNDPHFSSQWALPTIKAPEAWSQHDFTGLNPITVAVVDTGVDKTHADLSNRLLPGCNFARYMADGTPYDDAATYDDDAGHGTQVSGIIAAEHNNSIGISGVTGPAPVKLLPVKVLNNAGYGTVFDLANGIRYAADQGAKVINLSLTAEGNSQTLANAIRYAQDKGALVVAAIGDEDWRRIYPGAYPGVVTVGSIDKNLEKPYTWSGESHLDLVAPGVDIQTTNRNSSYGSITGTSAAASHVSGAAALYYLLNPSATSSDAANALNATALDMTRDGYDDEGWDSRTGWGLLDVQNLLGAPQSVTPVINFISPQPDTTLIGEVELEVELIDGQDVTEVAFYLDDTATPAFARVTKIAGQSFLTYTWDTTTTTDGQHTVYAQAYGNAGSLGESAELQVFVKNEADRGLIMQVLAPNGAVPNDASFSLYRRMSEDEEGYDPLSPYKEVKKGRIYADGLIEVPGTLALDLHTYTIVIQGTFDTETEWANFVYVRQLEGPVTEVIDGASTFPVSFSLSGASGILPYPSFFLRLKDDVGDRVATMWIKPSQESVRLLYLDEGVYDAYAAWSRSQAEDYIYPLPEEFVDEPAYFIRQENLSITADTREVAFNTENARRMISRAFYDNGEEAINASISISLGGKDLEDVVDGKFGNDYWSLTFPKELVLSPGQYDISSSVSVSGWDYYFSRKGFKVSPGPGIVECNFGGEFNFNAEVLNSPITEDEYLDMSFTLADSYGNAIISIYGPSGSYSRKIVDFQMLTYDSLDDEVYNTAGNPENWPYQNTVSKPTGREAGDWFAALRMKKGRLSTTGSDDIYTPKLPFTVVPEESDPGTGNTKAIQVYDYSNEIATAGMGDFNLFSLKTREDGSKYWSCEDWYKTDAAGKIHIPLETELSPDGNVLMYHGGPVEQRLFYRGQVFTELEDLSGELRLNECSIKLDISVLGSSPYAKLVAFLPGKDDNTLYRLEQLDGYTLFVTPGYYASFAAAFDEEKNQPCFWISAPQFVDSSGIVEMGTKNPAILTIHAADGYQFTDNHISSITHVGTGFYEYLNPHWDPSIQLTPDSYYVHTWVSRPDPDNDPDDHEGYEWIYGISLSDAGEELLEFTAGATPSFNVGGPFTADFSLDEVNLTTDDVLRGDVFIRDNDGNRVFAVAIEKFYGGGQLMPLNEYMHINEAGQTIIPQPEVLAQSADWPFVYPFLRLYKLNEGGTETRIFNKCADNYFYDFELPLDSLEPGDYRLELAISMGDGVLATSKTFSLNPSSAATLDGLPAATNQTSFLIAGSAAPNAKVTVFYRLGDNGERMEAGTTTADGIGRFSLDFAFPAEVVDGEYFFTAQATIDGVETPESKAAKVLLDRVAPAPPSKFTGEPQDSTHVLLSWEASPAADVKSYLVRRDGAQLVELVPEKLTHLDDSLTPATTYEYALVAIDHAGNESEAVTITVYTGVGEDKVPPVTPVKPEATYRGGGEAIITWQPTTDNIGVTSYKLFELTDGAEVELCTIDISDPEESPELKFIHGGLLNETTYKYAVRAYDATGNGSELSPICELTTPQIQIYSFTYRFPGQSGRTDVNLIYPETTFTLRMVGEKGRTATVEITYDATTVQGDTEEKTLTADLDEDDALAGTYTGEFTLPADAARLKSIRGVLTDGEHSAERDAGVSLKVTANLKVEIDSAEALSELVGLVITVWSGSQRAGQTAIVQEGVQEYFFNHLTPADDYKISIKGALNRKLVEEENVKVAAGRANSITLVPRLQAKLTVKVTDEGNKPLERVSVFARNNFTTLATTVTTDANGLAPLTLNTLEGEEIRVEITPAGELLSLPYVTYETTNHTAIAGSQTIELTLHTLPMGTISGTVTLDETGDPIPGVTVTAVHTRAGRSIPNTTISAADGTYTLHVPEGTNILTASTPIGHCLPYGQVSMLVQGNMERNLKLNLRAWTTIDVQLETKYIDRPPVLMEGMDWWSAVHFHLEGYDSLGRRYSGFPLKMRLEPYEEITIGVDGREAGLPTAEQTITVDENRKGKVTFRLEEYGRIVGRLVDERGNDFPLESGSLAWSVQLLEITSPGHTRRVHAVHLDDASFQISVPQPGNYELFISRPSNYVGQILVTYPTATIGPISVGMYDIKDVGDVRLAWDKTDAKAYFTTNSDEVAAGSVVNCAFRIGRNSSKKPMGAAQVTVKLPTGCELVEGSLAFEGQLIAPEKIISTSPSLVVDLGDLELNGTEEKVLNFSLRLSDPLPHAERVLLSGHFRWLEGGKELTVNPVPVEIMLARVTLNAPNLVTADNRKIGVHGRGPAGAEISVYDGADLLGIATASPGGYWQLQVTLPDRGYPVQHELQAMVLSDDGLLQSKNLQSDIVRVMYNPREPVIVSATLQQGKNGRIVTFNPSEGIAQFPYVVRPGEGAFNITVRFNKPGLVDNVRIGVGGFSAKAKATSEAGQEYKALVNWDGTKFGSIWVEYDTKKDASQVRKEAITEEQLRYQTPPGMRDYQADVDKELGDGWRPADLPADWPAESYSAAIDVVFGSRQDMTGRVEVSMAYAPDYVPTPEDIKTAQETGIPVYGLTIAEPTLEGDTMTMLVECYIPVDVLQLPTQQRFVPLASVGGFVRQLTKFNVKHLEDPIDTYEGYKDARDLLTGSSMFDKYSELMDQADNCGHHSDIYRDLIEQAANRKMTGEAVKWGLKLAGCILAPVSFGWGTVALFAASELIEWGIDHRIESNLDVIKQHMDEDPSCRGEDEWWHELADEIRRKNKIAQPTWIWDPSGIVYAGVMDNPIEGVKATAYEIIEGEPVFWDADWFGQENPLYTDGVGYYGWDVPEGLWQATYEKEGYAPAESAVLPVPPPQTEVHINLVNLTPPQVVAAAAAGEGQYLQVTFDQYMLVDTLSNDTVWVTYQGVVDSGDDEEAGELELHYVKGTVEAYNAVPSSDNPELLITRQLRFIPNEPLTVGQEYKLTIDGIVQNYGGIPMGASFITDLTIPAANPTVPEVSNLQVAPDYTWIDLTWKDPAGAGLQVEIVWKDNNTGEEVGRKIVSQGVESYQIPHLFSDSKYTVTVSVIDCLGNKSAGVERQVQTEVVELPKVPDPPKPPKPPVTPSPSGPSQPIVLGEVTAAIVTANDGSITLTWTDPTAATLKEIKIVWLVKGTDTILGEEIVKKGTQTFTIDGLTNGTEYEVRIHTIDRLGKESAGLVLTAIPHPVDMARWQLTGEQQTLAAFADGLRISIPAEAFTAGTQMTAQNLGKPQQPTDETLSVMGNAYTCATDAEATAKPLFLALQYDAELLGSTDARQLGIYRQDEEQPGKWSYIGGVVDLFNHRVTAEITQLGTYAVMLRRPVFIDLKGHWGKLDVEIMAARGLAAGVGGGKFDPDRPITRAELVTFIMRLVAYSGKELPAATGEEKVSFTDLAPSAWYGGMVRTAARLGLLQSTTGRFRPNDVATREEMADMLVRVLELLGQPASDNVPTPPFTDLKQVSNWATASVAKVWYKGIMGGMGNGTLAPQGTSTRAQVAAVMVRVLDRLGLLTATAVEQGTLQISEDGQRYELVNCASSDTNYQLAAVSEEVKRQLEDLVGQFVRVTGLRVQSSNQSQATPQLRVLSVTKSAEG